MHFIRITLVALLMAGATFAKTPPAAAREADRSPSADEDLSLAALEGLMAQSPERALPILKKVLAGSQTPLVKQRALFVLGQIEAPEAREMLSQMTRSPDAALRGEAIRSTGIAGDRKALDALQAVYNAGDSDVKDEVLQAWLIAGYKEAVYQAVLSAKTEDDASNAIHILGAMGASEELRKLGEQPNAARGLLDAYAISGDLESLRKIAEGSGDRSVRIEAISKIGIVQSDAARTALRGIYARGDEELRDAALKGMLIANDQQGVLALYRAAKTSEEKRALLRTLTMMDGDAALEAIDSALEKKP